MKSIYRPQFQNVLRSRSISVNPRALKADYAVRGEIVAKADEISKMLKSKHPTKKYHFDHVVYCNIGNPQALLQQPLTFPREVISLFESPLIFNGKLDAARGIYSEEAIERAMQYIRDLGDWRKSGAYTESRGLRFIREVVVEYIHRRDESSSGKKLPAVDPDDIFLINGASSGIEIWLSLLAQESHGVMIPIPQYPLYTATLTMLDVPPIGYYLDEADGWSLSLPDLIRHYEDSVRGGVTPKAIVVINPGNPTGQVLSESQIGGIIDFCKKRNLVILADEVYQENVYTKPFHSFHSVAAANRIDVPIVSFHSISKGIIGECGRRGGYMHFYGISPEVAQIALKLSSIQLCPNVSGQLMVDLMLRYPKAGTPAAKLHQEEYDTLYKSLKHRASYLVQELNKIEGIRSNDVEGAMYAFPSITLPPSLIDRALKNGRTVETADVQWAMELLERTGVVVVPGSGFRQAPGSYHVRMTILPKEKDLENVVKKIAEFHEGLK